MYTNGASPTIPALDMTSSGVNLHSGDAFNVHMSYDGTTLKMTITDAGTPSETFSASWPINIPATVGGNTANVGFTGGTGGVTATQEIISWTYVASSGTSTAATPTFNPLPGTYNSPQSVTLSDTTSGAVIHCTTDGSTPTASSPVCTTVQVNATTTIQAIAVAPGFNNSAVASGTYTLVAATPTFNPLPGTYNSTQAVTLSDTTTGAVIHCTMDGSTPTASSPVCTTVQVNTTTTIQAIAVAPGFNNSAVASGTYTLVAATPTFNPLPGNYTSPQSVTLSDTTAGAAIHCTTDGSTPTASSPVCTTVQVNTTTTIKAIAVATGFNNSAVASGLYTISSGGGINYGAGFTATGLTLNGKSIINGTRLRLTDGGSNESKHNLLQHFD